MRLGRLAPDYSAPYEVVDRDANYRLRHYTTDTALVDRVPLLLIPPLMVTAEIYDVAPELSAVTELSSRGIDVFVVDFGAPEHEEGGMTRTLPDHVRAIDRAIDRVATLTGRSVHVAGYSQGGMFAYQTAAYRRSRDIASIATFGAPVDVHRNVPALRSDAVNAVVHVAEPAISRIVSKIEGLPSALTSTGFKLLSTRKELAQRIDFLRKLHDRSALVRREARRRFLGGAGFVAWPGPAFRDFVSDFIVHNRMLSGGFVIDGRTLTLADITSPILALVGRRDDMARPAAVRAIERAAPNAAVTTLEVDAGHFGLVVGSRATSTTWPLVASWIRSLEGLEPPPAALSSAPPQVESLDDEPDGAGFEVDVDVPVFLDTLRESAVDMARSVWARLGDVVANAGDAYDSVRYREPRLRRLLELDGSTRVSASLALAEQAAKNPDATFFLWQSRAFSFREADERVTNVAKGLHRIGVRPGQRVAVIMNPRPSLLSLVSALGRIGAIAVVAPPEAPPTALQGVLAELDVAHLVCDPAHAAAYRDARAPGAAPILVLGGGATRHDFGEGIVDMERIDPASVTLPADLALDAQRGSDIAMILVRTTLDGGVRAVPITNRRWALSAWGAAASCTLKPEDTLYCPVPLHHPSALLVGVGAAIAGGARLALGDAFSPERFFAEVRRYGATVVLYVGEMLRPLAAGPKDHSLPVRTFAGSGMRTDLAARLSERFGARTLEFYASTTERAVLANAAGKKLGALGRPLPGSAPVSVIRFDVLTGDPLRDVRGDFVTASIDEPGLLAVRLDADDPRTTSSRIGNLDGAGPWIASRDVLRVDEDGDHWYVESVAGYFRKGANVVSTRALEDAIYALDEVAAVAVYPIDEGRSRVLAASVAARGPLDPSRLAFAFRDVPFADWPSVVFEVAHVPMNDGFRPDKRALASRGASPEGLMKVWRLDDRAYA